MNSAASVTVSLGIAAWAATALGCVSSTETRPATRVVAATADGSAVGSLAWGVGPAPGAPGALERPLGATQDPQRQAPQRQGPPTEKEAEEARIRAQFGSSVLIGADGRVTKQYFLVGDLGATFLKLVTDIAPDKPVAAGASPVPPPGSKVGGAQSQSILGRMLGGREVEVTYVPDFEVLNSADLADPPAAGIVPSTVRGGPLPAGKAPTVGLALVTGLPSALAAFEAALNLFYASIPQVEITVQVIEYSTADALAFGVSGVDDQGTPNFANLSSSQLVQAYTSIFPLRQPIVGASPVTDVGLFTLGGIHDSIELNVLLQALEANNVADITSSPKLVVRNGGIAAISTLTQVPFPKAKINQLGSQVATDIEFKPVGVKMNIIPTIAGTDSILLQVYADVSAITGFADTDPVVTPITSTRTAVTTVYLKDKHSLLIGGLKSQTTFENEQKVPILGDIPILGFLFRSTSVQRSDTNVAFQITPRIVTDRGTPVGSGPDS